MKIYSEIVSVDWKPPIKLIDTGKLLTADQISLINGAKKGSVIRLSLSGQTIIDSRPPHALVRQSALDHGLPATKVYAADTVTGEIYYLEYAEEKYEQPS